MQGKRNIRGDIFILVTNSSFPQNVPLPLCPFLLLFLFLTRHFSLLPSPPRLLHPPFSLIKVKEKKKQTEKRNKENVSQGGTLPSLAAKSSPFSVKALVLNHLKDFLRLPEACM